MMNLFHIESLSPLYEAVQTGGIFPDSKFFVDCTPKGDPAEILAAYEEEKSGQGFDLQDFVKRHFEYPETPETGYSSEERPIREHLNALWQVLLRAPGEAEQAGTLIPLPNPYIVPGGRFREVYYWDSYFTMLGLKASGRVDIIQDMVENFAWLIDSLGFIPNGNRSYYAGRSQPPFFSLMVNLLAEIKGEETLLHYRPQMEKEYSFWMAGESRLDGPGAERRLVSLPGGALLNRYWDDFAAPRPEAYPEDLHIAAASGRDAEMIYRHIRAAAESGWDFSSRWFADETRMETIQTADLIPVDLNCLLYSMEKTLLHIHRHLPDRVPADLYKERSRMRKNAIQEYCWNEEEGWFFDYNHVEKQPARAWTLAGVYPLFFNIATEEQAARVAQHLEAKFLCPGGLQTTLRVTGQQWDAPNGWAPLQWMAYRGLLNYGHTEIADKIRNNWLKINEKTYAETGKMMEKYNVANLDQSGGGGEYPNQDGFGWTNGVYLAMRGMSGKE